MPRQLRDDGVYRDHRPGLQCARQVPPRHVHAYAGQLHHAAHVCEAGMANLYLYYQASKESEPVFALHMPVLPHYLRILASTTCNFGIGMKAPGIGEESP